MDPWLLGLVGMDLEVKVSRILNWFLLLCRLRDCSEREFQRGDEIAWYADGDKIVRSEYNPATAYAFGNVSWLISFSLRSNARSDLDYEHFFYPFYICFSFYNVFEQEFCC